VEETMGSTVIFFFEQEVNSSPAKNGIRKKIYKFFMIFLWRQFNQDNPS